MAKTTQGNVISVLFSLRIEVILVGIGLVFLGLEFILSIAAILTFQR